jgi:hypothetical protein
VTNDKQLKESNLTVTINSASTDIQIPSAKSVYYGLETKQNKLNRGVQVSLGTVGSTTDTGSTLNLGVSGTLGVVSGGTGATTTAGALTNLNAYSKSEVNNLTNAFSPNQLNTLPDGRKIYLYAYNGSGTMSEDVSINNINWIYRIEGFFKAVSGGSGSCIGYPDSGGYTCNITNVSTNFLTFSMSGDASSSGVIRAWIWCY